MRSLLLILLCLILSTTAWADVPVSAVTRFTVTAGTLPRPIESAKTPPATSAATSLVKPAEKPRAGQPGQHSHKCGKCGAEWWHGADSFGNVAAHTCPRCGKVEWDIHRHAAQQVMAPRAAIPRRASSPCPGGVCPVRRRP